MSAPSDRHLGWSTARDRGSVTLEVAILAPEVIQLPEGSVKRFMQDAGMTSVQTKFPRILDDDRKALLRSYVVQKPA